MRNGDAAVGEVFACKKDPIMLGLKIYFNKHSIRRCRG